MSRALATALLREQAVEPWRCWIRHAPARWPGPQGAWVDLATGTLGQSNGEPELLAALHGPRLAELLYLPPVVAELAAARDRLAAHHVARGTPVLVQLLPGDALPALPAEAGDAVVIAWDLLALALREGSAPSSSAAPALEAALAGVAPFPGTATAVWPLMPGSGVDWDALAAALAAKGVAALQGLAVELSGRDRRALGEGLGEERYLRLFHGQVPAAADPARAAARHGLLPLLRRPLPRQPLHGAGNLRLAGELAACGELCLLLGEPESRAQALLRAARFAERESHDLAALAREGNLGVLPWLEREPFDVVAESAAGGEASLWRQLLARLAAA